MMNLLRVSALLILSGCPLIGCDSLESLERSKKETLAELKKKKFLLEATPVEGLKFADEGEGKRQSVQLGKSLLHVLDFQGQKVHEKGTFLTYPKMKVSVIDSDDKEMMGAFPKEWGKTDFEKMIYLEGVSLQLIIDAETPEELQSAVKTLTAKTVMRPIASEGGVAKVKGSGFHGLLSGDFKVGSKMLFQGESTDGDRFMMLFSTGEKGKKEDVIEFLKNLSISKSS